MGLQWEGGTRAKEMEGEKRERDTPRAASEGGGLKPPPQTEKGIQP